jgi:hypothetical protein
MLNNTLDAKCGTATVRGALMVAGDALLIHPHVAHVVHVLVHRPVKELLVENDEGKIYDENMTKIFNHDKLLYLLEIKSTVLQVGKQRRNIWMPHHKMKSFILIAQSLQCICWGSLYVAYPEQYFPLPLLVCHVDAVKLVGPVVLGPEPLLQHCPVY